MLERRGRMRQIRGMAAKRSRSTGASRGRPALTEGGRTSSILFDPEAHEYARVKGFQERVSMAEIVRRALDDYRKRHPIS